jgi:hypothetical protein
LFFVVAFFRCKFWIRHTTTATTINATKEIPVDDMQQENPSYDSIKSTCDDEEVQQTEHVVLISLPVPSVEGEHFGSPRLVDK